MRIRIEFIDASKLSPVSVRINLGDINKNIIYEQDLEFARRHGIVYSVLR